MEGLKLIETTIEYLYETKDLREKHIKLMEQEGIEEYDDMAKISGGHFEPLNIN